MTIRTRARGVQLLLCPESRFFPPFFWRSLVCYTVRLAVSPENHLEAFGDTKSPSALLLWEGGVVVGRALRWLWRVLRPLTALSDLDNKHAERDE